MTYSLGGVQPQLVQHCNRVPCPVKKRQPAWLKGCSCVKANEGVAPGNQADSEGDMEEKYQSGRLLWEG